MLWSASEKNKAEILYYFQLDISMIHSASHYFTIQRQDQDHDHYHSL